MLALSGMLLLGVANLIAYLNCQKICELREAKNLTQSELAEKSGTTERYLRDLEKGKKRNPSAILLCKLCFVLGVSVEDVVEIQDKE